MGALSNNPLPSFASYFIAVFFVTSNFLVAQVKTLTPQDYKSWNKIADQIISDDGDWVTYLITNENGDSNLRIFNTRNNEEFSFSRASSVSMDANSNHVVFIVSAHVDTIKALKRRKVKKSKLPKDTLVIFDLANNGIERIPDVTSYKLSNDHGSCVAWKPGKRTIKKDSTLVKDEGEENGTKLVIKNLQSGKVKVVQYVKEYEWSEKSGHLAIHTTGMDSLRSDKVLLYEAESHSIKSIYETIGEHSQFSFDKEGANLTFLSDTDTAEVINGSHELITYDIKKENASAQIAANVASLKNGWQISEHARPYFLEETGQVIFGVMPTPSIKDTTLLDEEVVEVEIWHYKDELLHTQQESNKKKEEKRHYKAVYDPKSKQVYQLNDLSNPEIRIPKDHKGKYLISYDNTAYQKYLSWLGHDYKDVYKVDLLSGRKTLIKKKLHGNPRLSPSGKHVVWFSRSDTSWNTINLVTNRENKLTSNHFYDELNDRPMDPYPSGMMGWTSDDAILLYDHYDIWRVDLQDSKKSKRLTEGRDAKLRYRYVSLNKELKTIPSDTTLMLSLHDEVSKENGFATLDLKSGELDVITKGPFQFSDNVIKAKETDDIIYTKESFDLFPDLILSDVAFTSHKTISNANPQQKEYGWGSIELFKWTDIHGIERDALLAKPPGFSSGKKYPLIVNFYEKSSQHLYKHRAPYAHRSTINYTYYTNNGYLILNPDVFYRDGYPGESSYDAVMACVDKLIESGFVDTTRMALQGHSWGGYQIAYILTKTNRFKCAESGAPVVNMVSAYGGIRWGSGMSRMFQYERTQSRLGATLWERPDLYVHNSPVFNLDKVETPVLILHNDKDGAVPWYQGIEYFVGLRRLGKPAWMLNYNDEPHWPVKKQNRIDFNIRMQQFFDHYLKDGPLPIWMKDGVPVIKKGIEDGLGISEEK